MSKPTTAVANRPNTNVATSGASVPDFMKEQAGAGTEHIDQGDMEMPRIKLVQGTDQELIATHDELKAGMFWHTLAEVSLGTSLNIVPLYISKRVVLWRPRKPVDDGGILARADDAVHWVPADTEFTVKIDKKGTTAKWKTAKTVSESGLLNWGTFDPSDKNSQPAATLCHVIVVGLPDYPEYSPVALFLQRTAIRPARKLLGKINIVGGRAPIYGQVYNMTPTLEKGPSGEYFNYVFTTNGFVDKEDDYKAYKQLHEQFKRTGVKIKEEDDGPEAGAATTAEAPLNNDGTSKY